MDKTLVSSIKDNYRFLYEEYFFKKEQVRNMNGLVKLAPMFGMDMDIIVPIFENDIIEIVQSSGIEYTEDDKCNLYTVHARIPDYAVDFVPEVLDYIEGEDGLLVPKTVPNKCAGEFRGSLEKLFGYFVDTHKVSKLKNIVVYKSTEWDGVRINIDALILQK